MVMIMTDGITSWPRAASCATMFVYFALFSLTFHFSFANSSSSRIIVSFLYGVGVHNERTNQPRRAWQNKVGKCIDLCRQMRSSQDPTHGLFHRYARSFCSS